MILVTLTFFYVFRFESGQVTIGAYFSNVRVIAESIERIVVTFLSAQFDLQRSLFVIV